MATLQTMYPPQVNSISTGLSGAITSGDTTITVFNAAVLPAPPNLLVIGDDSTAETVLLTAVNGNTLTVQRAVQGTARSWSAGTVIARNWTAADHQALIDNINAINTDVGSKVPNTRTVNGKALSENISLDNTDVDAEASGSVNTHNSNSNAHSALFSAKSGKAVSFDITLTTAGWNGNAQTISDAKFIASGYDYIVTPVGSDLGEYASAMIYADDVSTNGQMTFYCSEVPSSALTVNITRIESTEG